MRTHWEFLGGYCGGDWHWRLVDACGSVLRKSSAGFASVFDCIQDAKLNGYGGMSGIVRRRVSEAVAAATGYELFN